MKTITRLHFSREFVPANSNHISSTPFITKGKFVSAFNVYILFKVDPYPSYYMWKITMKKYVSRNRDID